VLVETLGPEKITLSFQEHAVQDGHSSRVWEFRF
jgi:hypothetical protein